MQTDVALTYRDRELRPIRLREGTKAAELKWKEYQSRPPTEDEVRAMFASGKPNIGLVTGSGLVVVDVDDPALLEDVIAHVGRTPMMCRTPSGGTHLYYRMRGGVHYGNAVKINGKDIDLRCEGAYVVAPWSHTEKGSYKWIGEVRRPSELPLPKIGWLRDRRSERKIKPVETVVAEVSENARVAMVYVSKVEGAISGQRGHDKFFRVVCKLLHPRPRGFGLSVAEAMPIIANYNATCEPPFTEKEIQHKIEDSLKKI